MITNQTIKAIRLDRVQGLKYKELAAKYGISLSSVQRYLSDRVDQKYREMDKNYFKKRYDDPEKRKVMQDRARETWRVKNGWYERNKS